MVERTVLDARCYVCGHLISGPVTTYTDKGLAHPTCVNCSPHAEARIAELEAQLAAKDEKIQALNDECQQSMLDIARERDRAERAEAQLAERGKPFIAAAEEAYWLLAWTWQSHLTGPGKPFDMSIFAPEARNMMTKAEQDLFDALSEIEP